MHTRTTWIADAAALAEFLDRLPALDHLGVDTEFMRRDSFYARLALLQIGTGGEIALIDPLRVRPDAALRGALEARSTTCVMHSAGEDIEVLADWLPDGPAELFDTQIAAALAGMGAGLSYQKLVALVTGVELAKGETRSDWMHRPLSPSQREYAAQDVAYLDELHQALVAKLGAQGRLEWLREDCARIVRRAHRDDTDPQPQRALRAAADWNPEAQARLRRLLLWREATARALDKPRPWLIDNNLALDLASAPPRTLDELAERTRGQRALRSDPRRALFEELSRPIDADDIAATAAIPAAPGRDQRKTLDAMKRAVDALAEELGIPAGTLCPRRQIEDFLMTGSWPEALEGWRAPLLRPRLEPLIA